MPEELIFIAILVIFSVLDAIARKKKQQRARVPDESTSRIPEEWEWEADLETYDEEPSYDETYEVERTEPGRPTSSGSSEGMIPADIWEEIAGLTRRRTPEPEPPAPTPVEVEPVPARATPAHRVHLAHLGYGTDPSTRARSEQDGLDPLTKTLGRDARSVRRQLRSHSKSALRRAVILQEVLGPPAATRPERFPE